MQTAGLLQFPFPRAGVVLVSALFPLLLLLILLLLQLSGEDQEQEQEQEKE
jgi:hypothetical protein